MPYPLVCGLIANMHAEQAQMTLALTEAIGLGLSFSDDGSEERHERRKALHYMRYGGQAEKKSEEAENPMATLFKQMARMGA